MINYELSTYWRLNRHVPESSIPRDVWEIVQTAILGSLIWLILVLVMSTGTDLNDGTDTGVGCIADCLELSTN